MKIGCDLIAHLNFVIEVYVTGIGSQQEMDTWLYGERIELKICMYDVWFVIRWLLVYCFWGWLQRILVRVKNKKEWKSMRGDRWVVKWTLLMR